MLDSNYIYFEMLKNTTWMPHLKEKNEIMHPCLLPVTLCSRNRFVSFATVEDVKDQLQNVDFSCLRPNVSVASVPTLWPYRSYSWKILCIFPMQQINLEVGLTAFPKSVPQLVPRSHPSCMCSADRSDHHYGWPAPKYLHHLLTWCTFLIPLPHTSINWRCISLSEIPFCCFSWYN